MALSICSYETNKRVLILSEDCSDVQLADDTEKFLQSSRSHDIMSEQDFNTQQAAKFAKDIDAWVEELSRDAPGSFEYTAQIEFGTCGCTASPDQKTCNVDIPDWVEPNTTHSAVHILTCLPNECCHTHPGLPSPQILPEAEFNVVQGNGFALSVDDFVASIDFLKGDLEYTVSVEWGQCACASKEPAVGDKTRMLAEKLSDLTTYKRQQNFVCPHKNSC
jgi:hypothetical protein